MKPTLPQLMSLNGGFIDTAGFLALHGLFTAHVTGNFVTIGAALVHGTSGAITKLLALPVFCAMVILARLVSYGLPALGLPVLRTMLAAKAVLLLAGGVLAIRFGPLPTATAPPRWPQAWCSCRRWRSRTRCTASTSAVPRRPRS